VNTIITLSNALSAVIRHYLLTYERHLNDTRLTKIDAKMFQNRKAASRGLP